MAMKNGKWIVEKGDCLWNIAKSVYGKGYRWTEIADANGISRSKTTIYPGQKLTIPGKSSSSSSPSSSNINNKVTGKKVRIDWWALDAGTSRSMFVTWSYDREHTDCYEITWEYNTGAGGWRIAENKEHIDVKQAAYDAPEEAKKVRFKIKPISKTHSVNNKEKYYWTDGETIIKEYDFSNNPPGSIGLTKFEIDDKNNLNIESDNIDMKALNGDSIELSIYQNDTNKWKTAIFPITIFTDPNDPTPRGRAIYTCKLDPGSKYKVRCRAIRNNIIYGPWSEFTDNDCSVPIPPKDITTLRTQVLSEQGNKTYGVFIEWTEETTAKRYIVEWSVFKTFDDGQVNGQTTEEGKGPRLLVNDVELGHEYYFRVGSINDKGQSIDWSPIKSISLGTKPSAPTTYSNTNKCIIGEDLNLYWINNSTDGSFEEFANLCLTIIDSAHPGLEPLIKIVKVRNDRPEEDKNKTSVYTINTNDPDWATVKDGYIIRWKVQTAGVSEEPSDWSIEREVNVFSKPEVEIDLLNNHQISIDEINSFPFYISVNSRPTSQKPISYYVEIVSNHTYETIDDVGKIKMVNIGDKIYQKYYDPQDNPWHFLLEMTPGNIDLENEKKYTINVTVSMDSGLTAISKKEFIAYLNDLYYDVYADVIINEETLEASIHPYCYEYVEDNIDIINENSGYDIILSNDSYVINNNLELSTSTIVSIIHNNEKCSNLNINKSDIICPEGVSINIINNNTSDVSIEFELSKVLDSILNIIIPVSVLNEETQQQIVVKGIFSFVKKELVSNCILSVYRHEYDGSFIEIGSNIQNIDGCYITDPHPSLDYARYRVVAKMNDTGAISYGDIKPVEVKESSIIIQWAEEWNSFMSDDEGSGLIEPPWSGSMLKLPYNINISDSRDIDMSLVEYAGRKRPVSYYGTQLGESSTWSTEIPKYDKETLYAIRRLSSWTDDVYVREPSGLGYWANVSISYNIDHSNLTIPITINVKRVEGGI